MLAAEPRQHSTQPSQALGEAGGCTSPYPPALPQPRGEDHARHSQGCHIPTWLCPSVAAPSSQAFPAVLAPHFCGTARQRSSGRRTGISQAPCPGCLTNPSLLRVGRMLLPPITRHTQFNQPLAFASKHNAVHPTPQIPSAGHMCQIDEKHDS